MLKNEFLSALREKLKGFPKEDIERSADYYCEMIDDRMEDGMSEEDAVAAIGSVKDAAAQAVSDISLPKIIKERMKPRRELHAWEILLIVLGAPLWLSLGIAAFAVFVAVYTVIWSIIIALYAINLAIALATPACITAAVVYFIAGKTAGGILSVGSALFCAGTAILLFFGGICAVKATVTISKRFLSVVKSFFVRKERKQ